MRPHPTLSRLGAGAAVLAVALLQNPGAALAATTDDVQVTNTETIQVYTDATGAVESRRVYEQLAFTGHGTVTIDNPVEPNGLRNLDGFGGFDVTDGVQHETVDVDGTLRQRAVSDYEGNLPLTVSVAYTLDGQPVEPGDVVGRSGLLGATYTVKNTTSASQQVSFPDGKGGTVTQTVQVPIPIVGSLSTVLPSNFTDVASDSANMAGDGHGGTKLSFTMTLFPPLGSDTATFGYSAEITDGLIPPASIAALPVNPLASPTFKTAGDSYKSGSDTGIKLAAGASEIDGHLLQLRDGAGDLLAGLIKLSDGADQLNAGLAGKAAPGAAKLAAGATDLHDGLGKIDDGAGKLANGAGALRDGLGRIDGGAHQLADGTGQLRTGLSKLSDGAAQVNGGAGQLAGGTGSALAGGQKLTAGLGQISSGLNQLADTTTGLPKAAAAIDLLRAGVGQLLAGFGDDTTAGTLLHGLNQLKLGLPQAVAGAQQISGGLSQLKGGPGGGLTFAKAGVDQIQAGIGASVAPGGSLDQLIGALTGLTGSPDCGPVCQATIGALLPAIKTNKAQLQAANQGLLQISAGLGQALSALSNQLIPGTNQLAGSLQTAADGAATLHSGAAALQAGTKQVSGGLDQLKAGLAAAIAGVLQLSTGADAAYAGSGALTTGLGQLDAGAAKLFDGTSRLAAGARDASAGAGKLDAGAQQLAGGTAKASSGAGALADGAGQLADGTGKAADGSQQLADGAGELSTGLGDAADGSGRLADGLHEARTGAPKLVDGAGRLSKEGMSQLIGAGEDTAQNYGKLYATIRAGADRADTESMAYGAPAGAVGLTAYSFEIKGESGEAGRNLQRSLAALVIGGAGLGAFLLRRRLA
jgi:putative membrane protein